MERSGCEQGGRETGAPATFLPSKGEKKPHVPGLARSPTRPPRRPRRPEFPSPAPFGVPS